MARKKESYKEPASYFTPSMLKVAEEWDKQHGTAAKSTDKAPAKKPAAGKTPAKKK